MMRRILINYAELRNAAMRAGYAGAIPLDDALAVFTNRQVDSRELNGSLEPLVKIDPQQGKVLVLRHLGGRSMQESAEVLGLSPAAVKCEWNTASLWLARRWKG